MINGNPLVSIIIPAYNAEKYIAEAIESILNQTYKNWELIIVNDGSLDNTLGIAKKYESDKVKVFSRKNHGASATRNYGFSKSKGQLIKYLDADDILNETHLEVQVTSQNENENVILSSTIFRFYNDDLQNLMSCGRQRYAIQDPINWLLQDEGSGLNMMQSGMFLIPRYLIPQSGGWDESLNLIDDFDFFPRIFFNAKSIVDTPDAIIYYRSGISNSLSKSIGKEKLRSAFKALEATTKLLLLKEPTEQCKKVLANIWRTWSYQFYPETKDLCVLAEEYIDQLGGAPHTYHHGKSGMLAKAIGWKLVEQIKYHLND